jgi:predicted RNase H-like HicB family nuclease
MSGANKYKYQTIIKLSSTTDGQQCYVAYHPEIPNCMSQGETPGEAQANLQEATEMCLEHLASNGLPIPEPFAFGQTQPALQFSERAIDREYFKQAPEFRSDVQLHFVAK